MCCTLRNIKYFIMLQLSFSGLSDWRVYTAEESSSFNPIHEALRQGKEPNNMFDVNLGPATDSAKGAADRYRVTSAKSKHRIAKQLTRSTLLFISQRHYCDHMAKPCMHAYVTGKICAITVYSRYNTFDTYCLMEYVNCREGSEIWRIAYTGACFSAPKTVTDYMMYAYHDDHFMDDYYVLNDKMTPV